MTLLAIATVGMYIASKVMWFVGRRGVNVERDVERGAAVGERFVGDEMGISLAFGLVPKDGTSFTERYPEFFKYAIWKVNMMYVNKTESRELISNGESDIYPL